MAALSEQLKKLAEVNFCEKCYPKYLVLIHGYIDYLLSEPIADWRQTEHNINVLWIKAKGLCEMNSTGFSASEKAFKKARKKSVYNKLKDIKNAGLIEDCVYNFLNKVRERRNKIHPPFNFSKQDYSLFREARGITDALEVPILFDLKDERWMRTLAAIERSAKMSLERFE